ncbi:MAG: hypothetical protein HXS54_06130 [Theionarchaea archaeon]|nr:hypothetical protein [Theionarchaea archaeon]DBA34837.1 TPA_asm: hypothetical protein vir521_00043 [Caudoviricetes sp. vir521]
MKLFGSEEKLLEYINDIVRDAEKSGKDLDEEAYLLDINLFGLYLIVTNEKTETTQLYAIVYSSTQDGVGGFTRFKSIPPTWEVIFQIEKTGSYMTEEELIIYRTDIFIPYGDKYGNP